MHAFVLGRRAEHIRLTGHGKRREDDDENNLHSYPPLFVLC